MIAPNSTPGFYKSLPEKIKLEILKEDMLKIYNKEKELEDSIIKFGYKKTDYSEALFYDRNETLNRLKDNL